MQVAQLAQTTAVQETGEKELRQGCLRLLATLWVQFPAAVDWRALWPSFLTASAPLWPRLSAEVRSDSVVMVNLLCRARHLWQWAGQHCTAQMLTCHLKLTLGARCKCKALRHCFLLRRWRLTGLRLSWSVWLRCVKQPASPLS